MQNLKTLSSEERERKTMALTGGPFGPGNPTGPWGPWGPWKEKAVGKFKNKSSKEHLYTLKFISTDKEQYRLQLVYHNGRTMGNTMR